jgi:hypothetical protein
MKKLVFRHEPIPDRYSSDTAEIVAKCAAGGYAISEIDAMCAWEAYSDSMCASWLMLHAFSDEVIVGAVVAACEVQS